MADTTQEEMMAACLLHREFYRHVVYTNYCDIYEPAKDDTNFQTIEDAIRFSWTIHFGPYQKGLKVFHHCGIVNCVNEKHLHLSPQTVEDTNLISNVEPPPKVFRKKSKTYKKLNKEDIPQVLKLKRDRWTNTMIAEIFDVSPTSIGYCLRTQKAIEEALKEQRTNKE